MAAILVVVTGFLGFVAALAALALGAGPLQALILWSATGLSATLLAGLWSALPRPKTAPIRA